MSHSNLPALARYDAQTIADKLDEHDNALNALEAGGTGRVLRVAQGSTDPGYYPTISAALVQAATLTPITANPVAIWIEPGTYTENLTLVSFGGLDRDRARGDHSER